MDHSPEPPGEPGVLDPRTLTRPAPALFVYYLIVSILLNVAFPLVFISLWFRYRTLRFQFDDQGISVSWGMFFKKEVYLTYRRIQDIHVTRNILQRWLGLATVEIQTASANVGAAVRIEGVLQPDALRDFLYQNMRGAREEIAVSADGSGPAAGGQEDRVLELLRAISDEVIRLRRVLEADQVEKLP